MKRVACGRSTNACTLLCCNAAALPRLEAHTGPLMAHTAAALTPLHEGLPFHGCSSCSRLRTNLCHPHHRTPFTILVHPRHYGVPGAAEAPGCVLVHSSGHALLAKACGQARSSSAGHWHCWLGAADLLGMSNSKGPRLAASTAVRGGAAAPTRPSPPPPCGHACAGRLLGLGYVYELIVKGAIALTENGYMPDVLLRAGIRQLLAMRAAEVGAATRREPQHRRMCGHASPLPMRTQPALRVGMHTHARRHARMHAHTRRRACPSISSTPVCPALWPSSRPCRWLCPRMRPTSSTTRRVLRSYVH